jgi:hypothetical protein
VSYEYVEYDDGERELYDPQDDPYELESAIPPSLRTSRGG